MIRSAIDDDRVLSRFGASAIRTYLGCFDEIDSMGHFEYRFLGESGKPLLIEVPADQYDEIVENMRDSIIRGYVPKINNPKEAENLVRKSKYTYEQVKGFAETDDYIALRYDKVSGVVHCFFPLGVSSYLALENTYKETQDEALSKTAAYNTALDIIGLSRD